MNDSFSYIAEFLKSYNGVVTMFVSVVAVAAVAIGICTYFMVRAAYSLLRVTRRQAQLTQEGIDLAREKFLASHRPKIVVHSIEYWRVPGDEKTDRVGASILCFNKGRTAAEDVEIRGDITVSIDLGGPDIQRTSIRTFSHVASGQKFRFDLESERHVADSALYTRRQNLPQPIYCIGTIIYCDKNKTRRETGFCFVVDNERQRWISAKRSEHEYQY